MCWLCNFNKTNPTEEQQQMVYLLFGHFCDVMDECAQLPKQCESFERSCNKAASLLGSVNRRPAETPSNTIARAIVDEMKKTFGPDVQIEVVSSTSLTNPGRRATDNVLPMRGKLDAETQMLFDAIEVPGDGKVH